MVNDDLDVVYVVVDADNLRGICELRKCEILCIEIWGRRRLGRMLMDGELLSSQVGCS